MLHLSSRRDIQGEYQESIWDSGLGAVTDGPEIMREAVRQPRAEDGEVVFALGVPARPRKAGLGRPGPGARSRCQVSEGLLAESRPSAEQAQDTPPDTGCCGGPGLESQNGSSRNLPGGKVGRAVRWTDRDRNNNPESPKIFIFFPPSS